MMRRQHLLLTLIVLASSAVLPAQTATPQAPRPAQATAPAPAVDPHAGWTQIFDGVSLKGWDGPMPLWHVEDGAIVVQSVTDPPTGSVYLIWQGGQPKDFEFETDIKLEGAGANSGIQFRASLLGEVPGRPMTKWESRGYQLDIVNASGAGNIIECCRGPRRGVPPRPVHASKGQLARASVDEAAPSDVLASIGDPAVLKSSWKPGEWNHVHLIARGRVLMSLVNGQLMAVLLDDNPTMFNDHGIIALQLEGSGANKASFKNIWIKQLP